MLVPTLAGWWWLVTPQPARMSLRRLSGLVVVESGVEVCLDCVACSVSMMSDVPKDVVEATLTMLVIEIVFAMRVVPFDAVNPAVVDESWLSEDAVSVASRRFLGGCPGGFAVGRRLPCS